MREIREEGKWSDTPNAQLQGRTRPKWKKADDRGIEYRANRPTSRKRARRRGVTEDEASILCRDNVHEAVNREGEQVTTPRAVAK